MRTANISTDAKLLELLKKSAKKKLSEQEIESQRLSFILSGLPKKSEMTKAEIKKAIR